MIQNNSIKYVALINFYDFPFLICYSYELNIPTIILFNFFLQLKS